MEGGTPATPHDNRRLAEFALRAAEYFFNGLDAHWPYSLAAANPSCGRQDGCAIEKAFQRLKVIS